MRIALIHKHFSTMGGTERYLFGLSHQLVSAGHQVHLFCARRDADTPLPAGCTYHPVPWLRGHYGLKSYSFNWAVRRVLKDAELRDGSFDVVQSLSRTDCQHIWRAGGGSHCHFRKSRGGRRTLSDGMIEALEKRSYGHSPIVIAVSELAASQLRASLGEKHGLYALMNPVDIARFSPQVKRQRLGLRQHLGLGESTPVALLVGTGFRRKGLALLIEAAGRARQEGTPWTIIALGADRQVETYYRRANSLRVPLILPGPRLDIEAFYGAADLFVLPTAYEPCSNALLEAMACGLPAITTQVNGAAEALGEGGIVLSGQGDTQSLCDALCLASSPKWRRLAGEAGREGAQGHSWTQHMARVEALYQQVSGSTY